jgi:hypothetical protein
VNIGHLCYTLGITVACVLALQWRKWPAAISVLGRLLTRTKRYCQSLTIINAGFVFDDQLRMSADGGYRRFLTPGDKPHRYDLNRTFWCHRFYYVAPFPVLDPICLSIERDNHEMHIPCQCLFACCVVWRINLRTVSQDQNAT